MAGLLTVPDRLDAVTAELHRWTVEPFDLALANCGLSVLEYVARVTGRPVPLWLRAFGRVGAGRLMRDDAQFEAVAIRALAQMRCLIIDNPKRGDVALVRLEASGLLTACIFTGRLWAARGDRAAVLGPGSVLKAWRVACQPQ